ncbi:hypothetical protein OG394_02570 [Kribbella sp. NBC_01245]|uniref:hypothetical protein n=1 Tax=Kribbella sp. NBC_01245 TaxID=2903578 RepID=UPI002E2C5714|nr:hypothetical protein [Kribbella sp. NBC_01245]
MTVMDELGFGVGEVMPIFCSACGSDWWFPAMPSIISAQMLTPTNTVAAALQEKIARFDGPP